MKFFIITLLIFTTGLANAENFFEKIKVTGFRCDSGKVGIDLRSFEHDRTLFLSVNETGDPKYFEILKDQCKGLIKNLGLRLNGKIFDLNFETKRFSREEQVYVPPRNPCQHGHTKCDDEGSYTKKTFEYERVEALIDGYRFFKELKMRE